MTTYFDNALSKLKARVSTLDSAFERNLLVTPPYKGTDRYALQEGLMSALWQAWCFYCRDIIFGSITGGVTVSGVPVSSPFSHHSDREIVYLAQRAAQGTQNISTLTVKAALAHQELTWGDALKLNSVVNAFTPSNANNLLSCLGSVNLLIDLQKFRNANAHITKYTIGEVTNAQVKYSHTKFRHPSDTMLWVDPSTNDYLWKSWVEEIEIIAAQLAQ